MELRLILGTAGTGKTYTCLEEISQECKKDPIGVPLLLIVPEHATFEMEYQLATAFEIDGTVRSQVSSFRRLVYRLFSETSGSAELPVNGIQKQLELGRILDQHANDLRVFAQSVGQPGFVKELASFIAEMKINEISPGQLLKKAEILAQSADGKPAAEKLFELANLYSDWETTGFLDLDDIPGIVAKRLKEADIYKGAKVWIDGFLEFNPQELAIISSLLEVAEQVNVTLNFNPEAYEESFKESDLFYTTFNTLRQLSALAGRSNPSPDTDLKLQTKHRFNNFPEGDSLEQSLSENKVIKVVPNLSNIGLNVAVNRRAELEGAAREIIRLCRVEDYRWKDICVMSRDLSLYKDLFPMIFGDHNIPYHFDEARTLEHHPLVEFIQSALEVIASDWSYEPVFSFLKTDLARLYREQVDQLENYVLEHGIKGSHWFEPSPWTFMKHFSIDEERASTSVDKEFLNEMNKLRAEAAQPLRSFQLALEQGNSARDYCVSLVTLFEDLKVSENLSNWSKSGNTDSHILVWEKVLDLLDKIVHSLGDEKISLQQFNVILVGRLEELKLPHKLPGIDQVLICSPDKCFKPNIKAAFLIGLNEGVMPAKINSTGLLSDSERIILQDLGLKVAPGAKAKAFAENMIIYLALTRASNKLWLSYSLADLEGKAQKPSTIVRRIKEIFPNIQESLIQNQPSLTECDDYRFIANPKYSLKYLAGVLREFQQGAAIPNLWWDVYNWTLSKPEWSQAIKRVVAGLQHKNSEESLGPELAQEVFGKQLKISVTRIEKYKACPFAHFATYALKLRERGQFTLDPAGIGDLFHAALRRIGVRLRAVNLDWADLSYEQCRQFATEAIEEFVPRLRSEILLSNERYKYLTKKLIRVLKASTWALAEQTRKGSFRALEYEMGFGRDEAMPSVVYQLGKGESVELIGRIDRVDTAEDSTGKSFVRVIDYKSGKPNLSLDDMYYGLKLQLLTYLQVAVKANANSIPAGFLYFFLSDPLVTECGPISTEKRDKEIFKQFKMKGYVLADAEIARLMDPNPNSDIIPVGIKKAGSFTENSSILTEQQYAFFSEHLDQLIREAASDILKGNVAIAPYKKGTAQACTYCKYKPICAFDLLLAENSYRKLKAIPKKEFWDLIPITEGVGTDDFSHLDH